MGDSPTLKLGAVSVSVARPFSLMMVVVFPFSQVLWQRLPLHVSLQMVGVKTSLIRPVWLATVERQSKEKRREKRRERDRQRRERVRQLDRMAP